MVAGCQPTAGVLDTGSGSDVGALLQPPAGRCADTDNLRELACVHRRFGYRWRHILLVCEGLVMNHKKFCRLYREEGHPVRRRFGRKRAVSKSSDEFGVPLYPPRRRARVVKGNGHRLAQGRPHC
jgi:hypothetical protein